MTTFWINGRVYCAACQRVFWIVQHPEAEVACPKCSGPTRTSSGDEAPVAKGPTPA